ncbi:MAG: hypothetical protein AAF497_28505 [Planctomycetota bacterium]
MLAGDAVADLAVVPVDEGLPVEFAEVALVESEQVGPIQVDDAPFSPESVDEVFASPANLPELDEALTEDPALVPPDFFTQLDLGREPDPTARINENELGVLFERMILPDQPPPIESRALPILVNDASFESSENTPDDDSNEADDRADSVSGEESKPQGAS